MCRVWDQYHVVLQGGLPCVAERQRFEFRNRAHGDKGAFPRTAPLPAVCVLSQWIRFCLGNMAQWPPAPLPFSKRLRLPSLATGKPHACWWAQVSRSGLALYWHGREPDTGQALPPLYGTHLASSKAGAGTFSCRILADDWYTFVVESWYKNSVA